MFEAVRDRMDAFAQRMAKFQTKLFLNVFYVLVVPFAHVYLRATGDLLHRDTGFFQSPENKRNQLDAHLKQY